jgi:hypothetical protein
MIPSTPGFGESKNVLDHLRYCLGGLPIVNLGAIFVTHLASSINDERLCYSIDDSVIVEVCILKPT